jgi:uncharacterized protein YjbI with pentapeptide repeats
MISRRLRLRRGGKGPRSKCPSLKTTADCVADSSCRWISKTNKCNKKQIVAKKGCASLDDASCLTRADCAWNPKTSKCRKRSVKKIAAAVSDASVVPKAARPNCAKLEADACASNADCAWNPKTNKCRKRSVRKVAAAPKVRKGCPGLDADACASNADCAWNAKTSKCRKRAVKKVVVAAPVAAAVMASVSPKAASPVAALPPSPVRIPADKRFKQMDLQRADFSGMNLRDVVFFDCNLSHANFKNAQLDRTHFSMCTLEGIDFSGATINSCEIRSCDVGHRGYNKPLDLKPLLLNHLQIKNTYFEGCDLANVNFAETTFENCDFNDVKTLRANFTQCRFPKTIVRGCDFNVSNFKRANFTDCDFNPDEDDDFEECLEGKCVNYFNGCDFSGVIFPNKVNMCSFADAVLTGSNISDPRIDIQGCYFDEKTEAEDVDELKKRATPIDEDDDEWGFVAQEFMVKQKTPSPVKKTSVKKQPVKKASPVKKAAAAPAATGCVKQTQKKYLDRPSPPYSAADCCGMTLPGNDGKLYTSVANAKGICAWKPAKN